MLLKLVLKDVQCSPRKAALVADFLRKKKELVLCFNEVELLQKQKLKKVFKLIFDLVLKKITHKYNLILNELYLKEIYVSKGKTVMRQHTRARGRSSLVRNRSSHIYLVLADKEEFSRKIDQDYHKIRFEKFKLFKGMLLNKRK